MLGDGPALPSCALPVTPGPHEGQGPEVSQGKETHDESRGQGGGLGTRRRTPSAVRMQAGAFQKLELLLEPLEGTQSCPPPDFRLPAPGLMCAVLSH